MDEIRITLNPGQRLVVECADQPLCSCCPSCNCNCGPDRNDGPDGSPDGEDRGGPEPTPGISLGEFIVVVCDHWGIAEEIRNSDNPQWPRDADGSPIPETHVWAEQNDQWGWHPA